MTLHLRGKDAVQLQGLIEKSEMIVDVGEGVPCNDFQVSLLDKLFEQYVHECFKPKCKAQGIEFHFVIAAIHGWDIYGEVPLMIYILPDFEFLGRQHSLFECLKVCQ